MYAAVQLGEVNTFQTASNAESSKAANAVLSCLLLSAAPICYLYSLFLQYV